MTNLCNSKTQNLLPIEQANAKIRNQLQAITGNEKLSLNTALGRTLLLTTFPQWMAML